jgi:SHAQKYF class myb-like DNA-binding protein
MKLFVDGNLKNQNRYKFKGYYAFKIMNESNLIENNKYSSLKTTSKQTFANNGNSSPIKKSFCLNIKEKDGFNTPKNVNSLGNSGLYDSSSNFSAFNQINKENEQNHNLGNLHHENDVSMNETAKNHIKFPNEFNEDSIIDNNNQSMQGSNFRADTNENMTTFNSNNNLPSFPEIFEEKVRIDRRRSGLSLNGISLGIKKKPTKMLKLSSRTLKQKKSVYNIGRWTEDEHRRFIEAILKYGNDWKNVQKHIRTRSSTQSRSHSQKFFLKIKNYDLFDFKDRKPCITSLNELAKNLDQKQIEKMTDLLISYEYQDCPEIKQNSEKFLLKKRKKELYSSFDNDMDEGSLNHLTNVSTKNYFFGNSSIIHENGNSNNNNQTSKNNEFSNNNTEYQTNKKEGGHYGSINIFSGKSGRRQSLSFNLSNRFTTYNNDNNNLYNNNFNKTGNINENMNTLNTNNSNDDFNHNFTNVFQHRNRRLSHEDNLLFLFSSSIIDDKRGEISFDNATTNENLDNVITESDFSGSSMLGESCELDDSSSYFDAVIEFNKSYMIV